MFCSWKTPESRKNRIILGMTAVAIVFMTALFILYHLENKMATVRSINEFDIGDNAEIKYCIEEAGISSSGDYRVKGWFVQKGKTYEVFNAGMMQYLTGVYNNNHLCYVKDNVVYELPTRLEYRSDVNDNIGDGIDYQYSGFYARLSEDQLDIMDGSVLGMIAESPDHVETLYLLEEENTDAE